MKQTTLIVTFLLFVLTISAQKPALNIYAAIDKKALELPDSLTKTTDDISVYVNANFNSDKEGARAIFIWIASNIQYDIENMFAINFYEQKADKIALFLSR